MILPPLLKGVNQIDENNLITLFGITVVCVTVLMFALIVGERLCSLNISNGNMVVQAILMCHQ
nr:Hok/Gef family protein [Proteus mirabilis]